MTIRICHVTSTSKHHLPRVVKECRSAAHAGLTAYVVCQGESSIEDGVDYIGVPPARSRVDRMMRTRRALIQKALEIDADIYQIHSPELLPYAVSLRNLGKIVIFDSHEFYGLQIMEKEYIPRSLRGLVAALYMKYEAHVNKSIDATIEVCTVSGQDYFEGRCRKRIFISNAVDLNEFSPQGTAPFDKRGSVAYIGNLSLGRGITSLVKGMARTKARLILAGSFSPVSYENELMRMPEYSCVDYRGFLKREHLAEVLGDCFAGISTILHVGQYSRVDTIATKVYEYMAMGLPVIISDTPYAQKLVEQYKFGIAVDPSSPEEIAQAVRFLQENPALAHELGMNGRRAVQEAFNWGIEEEKLLGLYRELTASGGPALDSSVR